MCQGHTKNGGSKGQEFGAKASQHLGPPYPLLESQLCFCSSFQLMSSRWQPEWLGPFHPREKLRLSSRLLVSIWPCLGRGGQLGSKSEDARSLSSLPLSLSLPSTKNKELNRVKERKRYVWTRGTVRPRIRRWARRSGTGEKTGRAQVRSVGSFMVWFKCWCQCFHARTTAVQDVTIQGAGGEYLAGTLRSFCKSKIISGATAVV